MSVIGGFFGAKYVNGKYDREYNEEDFAAYFATFISSGVFAKPSDQLLVKPGGGLSVDVSVGKAYIKGYWVNVPEVEHLTINPNMTGQTEQIKVVCEIDFDERKPVIRVVESVSSLLPDDEYQLVLSTFNLQMGESEITTAMLTDRRPDNQYCGFVTGLVDQIDFKTLMEQERAQFHEWFEAMKGQLSEDAAGNLQQQIDNLVIPTKTSELVNDGGGRTSGNNYYVKRGYYNYGTAYGSGPSEVYYNTKRDYGVVSSVPESARYPLSWSTGVDVVYEEDGETIKEISNYANPDWRRDWRSFDKDTSKINGMKLAVGESNAIAITNTVDGMFFLFSVRVKYSSNLTYYGNKIFMIPMEWIFYKTKHPYSWEDGTFSTDAITENFDLYNSSGSKMCSVVWVYRFVREMLTYAGGAQKQVRYKIETIVCNVTWNSGYTSGYELQLYDMCEIGSNMYSTY